MSLLRREEFFEKLIVPSDIKVPRLSLAALASPESCADNANVSMILAEIDILIVLQQC